MSASKFSWVAPVSLGLPLICPSGTSFMTARLLIDTNILIYALDPAEPEKRATSADLLKRTIANHTLALSPQNLNECYKILTLRRRLVPPDAARTYLTHLMPCASLPSMREPPREPSRFRTRRALMVGSPACRLGAHGRLQAFYLGGHAGRQGDFRHADRQSVRARVFRSPLRIIGQTSLWVSNAVLSGCRT